MGDMDFQSWRCKHEREGENLFCPIEGCPKYYGCARDHGWQPGDVTPTPCLRYVAMRDCALAEAPDGATRELKS